MQAINSLQWKNSTMKRENLSYLKAYDYFSNKLTLFEENFKQKSKFLTKLVYKNAIKRLGILLKRLIFK